MSDPSIKVTKTGSEHMHCICVEIGSQKIYLHTRSAIDLQHKLGLAILDWIGEATISILKRQND